VFLGQLPQNKSSGRVGGVTSVGILIVFYELQKEVRANLLHYHSTMDGWLVVRLVLVATMVTDEVW
jgi:hypothetical protein